MQPTITLHNALTEMADALEGASKADIIAGIELCESIIANHAVRAERRHTCKKLLTVLQATLREF